MGLTFHGYVLQAFSKGSAFVQDFNKEILQMQESGKMQELKDRFIASSKCLSTADNHNNDILNADSFIGLFCITIGTSTAALMLFYYQLWNYWQRHMPDIVNRMIRALGMQWPRQHPNGNRGAHGQVHRTNHV